MGLGNKLLSPYVRYRIGRKISKNIENRILSVDKIKQDKNIKYIPLKYNTDNKEEYILEIKNGSIFSSWGFILNEEKKLIGGTLPYDRVLNNHDEMGGRFASYLLKKTIKVSGNVFSLQSIWNVCFYHWINETLPKLFLLKDSGLFDKVDTIVLGDGCKSNFHRDSLKLLGIENKKIVYVSDETLIKCENLIVASLPGITTHNPPKWVCDKYRQFCEKLSESNNSTFYEKIYISRNKAPTRKTINELDILKLIEPLGYKLLRLEDYSLEEQFLIFYHAKKIIAPHGSGLTNMVCSLKGKTAILDIIPSIRYESVYKDIASTIGLKYFEYIEKDENNFKYYSNNNKANDFDMKVDIEKFRLSLNELEKYNIN